MSIASDVFDLKRHFELSNCIGGDTTFLFYPIGKPHAIVYNQATVTLRMSF